MRKSMMIPGTPQGKGRPRVTKYGTFTPQKTRDYEALIRQCWQLQAGGMLEGDAFQVNILAHFAPPKSFSAKRRAAMMGTPHVHKPDADNIAKAVLDALNGVAFRDDAAVACLAVKKYYAERQGVYVSVTALHEGGKPQWDINP